MILERRDFIRILGVTAGATGLTACGRLWSVPDEWVDLALRGPGLESEVATVCGLCPAGCGVTVRLVDGLPVGIKGNAEHPLNRGGLCPVGFASLDILYAPERLQQPMRKGQDGSFQPISWEAALQEIAARMRDLAGAGEGRRMALMSQGSPRLVYELSEHLLKALGSSNVARIPETNTTAYRLTQGIEELPAYDLAASDHVVTFGLDLYEDGPAPIHAISALIGSRSDDRLPDLSYVGTRISPSASKAQHRVIVRPGTEGAFALGVAHVLVRESGYDAAFVASHTEGFEDFTDRQGHRWSGFRQVVLERYYPDRVAQICGCEPDRIMKIARGLSQASAPVALIGGQATGGSNGTFNAMAVHALNALLGAFGKPGGVLRSTPVPLSPMPRLPEVAPQTGGALFSGGDPRALPGSHPVSALTDGILEGTHPLDLLILMGGDPVYRAPEGGTRLREALAAIPLVVAVTSFMDETALSADIVLPAASFLESWQCVDTPAMTAFATLGIGPPVIEPLYGTKHPGDILIELGRAATNEPDQSFPWQDMEAYLRARLAGLAASGQGLVIKGQFEESWVRFLADRGWRFAEQMERDAFWADLVRHGGWWDPTPSYGDWDRLFETPSGRFQFFSATLAGSVREIGGRGSGSGDEVTVLRQGAEALGLVADLDELCLPHYEPLIEAGDGDVLLAPFLPITARGTHGTSSRMIAEMFGYALMSGWETWAEIAPETAQELDLGDGDVVSLASSNAEVEAVIRVRPGTAPGMVHVPIGLGHTEYPEDGAGVGANPLDLLLPVRDPLSGHAAGVSTRVTVRLERRRAHGAPAPVEGGRAR